MGFQSLSPGPLTSAFNGDPSYNEGLQPCVLTYLLLSYSTQSSSTIWPLLTNSTADRIDTPTRLDVYIKLRTSAVFTVYASCRQCNAE